MGKGKQAIMNQAAFRHPLDFLISGFVMLAFSTAIVAREEPVVPDPHSQGEIGYINPDIPVFDPPEYPGDHYEAVVPATFDLAERARLALHGITSMTNPNLDYEIYFVASHMADPPALLLSNGDLACQGKFMEVLPLMRVMSGSDENMHVEKAWMEVLLRLQGPDGLIYASTIGRPWILPPNFDPASGYPGRNDGYPYVCLLGYSTARSLAALSIYAQKDPEGPWTEAVNRLWSGYQKVIIRDDEDAYVYNTWTAPGKEVIKPEKPFGEHIYLVGSQGWIAKYLAVYDRARQVPEASELAEKMMNYNMFTVEYNEPDGKFKWGGPGVGAGEIQGQCAHFHTHAMNIIAGLYVARQRNNEKHLERAIRAFEYGISKGDPMVGYFPMVTYDKYVGAQTAETCQVADMIVAAVVLSTMGYDQWDHVDRWTRNQLAENQLTQVEWITDGRLDRSRSEIPAGYLKEGEYTTENVAERTLGGFAGWPAANDWIGAEDWWGGNKHQILSTIMNCCTGGGARALFAVWRDMIEYDEGRLKIHLLMNRASKWADVDSHVPYTGRVDIRIKRKLNLEIRIPEWVQPDDVTITVNGKPRELEFDGRYAKVGRLRKGRVVVMTFPIHERTEKRTIEGFDYTFIVRGNDVVHVDPPGRYAPMYQRAHYRNGQTLWQKVTRFVSDESFGWW